MFLIVGLGNPGGEFDGTRHNIGFDAVAELAKRNSVELSQKKRLLAVTGKGRIDGKSAVLVLPETFMNNSGRAVKAVSSTVEFDVSGLIVIHDELDLPLGALKIKTGGGTAGHKGLNSIVEHLGTKDFVRVRIGIGKGTKSGADHVLSKFLKSEAKTVKEMIVTAAEAVEKIVSSGVPEAMNAFNKSK